MVNFRDGRLSPEQRITLKKASRLGKSAALGGIELDDRTLAGLIRILRLDLKAAADRSLSGVPGYFRMDLDSFTGDRLVAEVAAILLGKDPNYVVTSFIEACEEIPDFAAAFEAFCEIHKRRLKFHRIISEQPVPDADDLAPRGLLQFGLIDSTQHASWLRWSKWIYDLDNRTGQETGYMLMSIFNTALGGKPHTAKTSPIRRADGSGRRRADCIRDLRAYDFKARLTDAPSRRARLGDEIAFARDCRFSGYTPVLLCLKNNEPEKTEEMVEAYRNYDGEVYIGSAAWRHIRETSSPTMRRFVDHYLLAPMRGIENNADSPLSIGLSMRTDAFEIAAEGRKALSVPRKILPE